jgi:predicted MFS family arabinose efflux permease
VAELVPAAQRGTAFGWYHALLGLAALPASVVFGTVWDRWSSGTAFLMGATLALMASVWMSLSGRRG